jgi:hypothetical protein
MGTSDGGATARAPEKRCAASVAKRGKYNSTSPRDGNYERDESDLTKYQVLIGLRHHRGREFPDPRPPKGLGGRDLPKGPRTSPFIDCKFLSRYSHRGQSTIGRHECDEPHEDSGKLDNDLPGPIEKQKCEQNRSRDHYNIPRLMNETITTCSIVKEL